MKTLRIIGIALISLLTITGCTSSNDKTPTSITKTESTSSNKVEPTDSNLQPFGEKASEVKNIDESFESTTNCPKDDSSNISIKVLKISDEVSFKETNIPEQGKKFFGVELEFTNNSDCNFSENLYSKVFVINKDRSFSIPLRIFGSLENKELLSDQLELTPNEEKSGWLIFQNLKNTKAGSVQYKFSSDNGSEESRIVEWKVK